MSSWFRAGIGAAIGATIGGTVLVILGGPVAVIGGGAFILYTANIAISATG